MRLPPIPIFRLLVKGVGIETLQVAQFLQKSLDFSCLEKHPVLHCASCFLVDYNP